METLNINNELADLNVTVGKCLFEHIHTHTYTQQYYCRSVEMRDQQPVTCESTRRMSTYRSSYQVKMDSFIRDMR